jgi:hypothetical protein
MDFSHGPMRMIVMMIVEPMVVVVRGLDDAEFCGRDAGLYDTVGRDVCARRQQVSQGGTQLLKWQAYIQERAQNHVARSA